MFYSAIVLDNEDFPRTGKIRVRLQKDYLNSIERTIEWDLVNKPSFINEGKEDKNLPINQDANAWVYTPFSGGEQAGFFALPRPNTKGIVARLGDANSTEYIWMGGYFESRLGVFNVPNDEINETTKSGVAYGSYSLQDKNDIVMRTKSLDIPYNWDGKSTDSFNWKKQKTDNIVSLGRYRIKLSRIDYIDPKSRAPQIYEDIYIGEETKYKDDGTTVDKVERKVQMRCVDDKTISGKQLVSEYKQMADSFSFNVYNENTKITTNITFDKVGSIVIKANKDTSASAEITITPNNIKLIDGGTSVFIDKDKCNIKADKEVTLDAFSINIGGGDKKVLCTNSDIISFKTVDGLILSTSQKVKMG